MDPPYGGPRRSPGLSGPEVHGLVHPVIPSGRPCALFPARRGLRYRSSRLYTTTPWEALSGYASWMGTPTWGRRSYRDEVPDLGGRAFLVWSLPVWCGVGWGEVKTLWVSLIYIYARECSRFGYVFGVLRCH